MSLNGRHASACHILPFDVVPTVASCGQQGELAYHERMASVWWLRWVIVGIALLIGVVLIGSHHMLIGILILALATARAYLLVTIRKRREAFRARRTDRFGPPPLGGRHIPHHRG